MRPPSYRQRLFVEYHLGGSSGSAVYAARRAGYSTPHPAGVSMLRKATLHPAINARVATAVMAANEVLARVADVVFSNLLGSSRVLTGRSGVNPTVLRPVKAAPGPRIKRFRKNYTIRISGRLISACQRIYHRLDFNDTERQAGGSRTPC